MQTKWQLFLPGWGEVTSGTVTSTEKSHVSDNGNIMRVRAALKPLAMEWNPWQTIPRASKVGHMDQKLREV